MSALTPYAGAEPRSRRRPRRDAERDVAIMRLYDGGTNMKAIGDEFGVTRQRIRQIVKRLGGTPSRAKVRAGAENLAGLVRPLADAGHTAEEIARAIGIKPERVRQISRKFHIEIDRMSLADRIELMRLAAKVAAGASIRAAAGERNVEAKLGAFCRREGIRSGHGPHRDLSHRVDIVKKARAAGASWEQVASEISAFERSVVGAGATREWAERAGLHVARYQRAKPARAVRPRAPAAVLLAPPDVAGLTLREAAVALRGSMTAGQIAKKIGVSRNAVIGHWFRSRNGVPERGQTRRA